MVTLTQTRDFLGPRVAKKMLKAIRTRFERAWGCRVIFWKLEPQKRGAAHFHLLVLMGPAESWLDEVQWWARNWYEIAGAGDPEHLAVHLGARGNRPCVEVVRNWNGVMAYAAKYLGKAVSGEGWERPGRWWGVWRKELLPRTIKREEVGEAVVKLVRRQLVRRFEHELSGRFLADRVRPDGRREVVRAWDDSVEVREGRVVRSLKRSRLYQEVGWRILKRYHRRWPTSRGGCSMFVPYKEVERLLEWARSTVAGMVERKVVVSDSVVVKDAAPVRKSARWVVSDWHL